MLPLVTTKYLVPLTIIAVLSVTETDAQMDPDGNLVANNGIAIQRVISGGSDRRISQPSQPSQAPSGQGLNAFQTILAGFLLGSIYGRGFPYSPPYVSLLRTSSTQQSSSCIARRNDAGRMRRHHNKYRTSDDTDMKSSSRIQSSSMSSSELVSIAKKPNIITGESETSRIRSSVNLKKTSS
ncbi:hypothetical protein LOAG_11248 [Loa loa]|uniref:Uncharacterized protein n=1 Tax=Loa loa TaxID=7209 RepID=A0A1S0TN96_LOALO|nr:hypothetical protein LOAG_11248 [Loa loa]EFO17252.2 hypothetical protein LOAG_11248 [Loa loa]